MESDVTREALMSIAKSLKIIAKNMEQKNEMNDRIIQWMDKYPEFEEFMKGYNCGGYHE